jgi:hypothetical protein
MSSRLGQAMPRFLAPGNIAGAGLQERLRSTIFALLGLVTAVGLGLVGIAFNQGWPDFVGSPIPEVRTERVGEASVAADAVRTGARPTSDNGSPGSGGPGRGHSHGRANSVPGHRSAGLDVSAQHQLPATAPQGQSSNPPSSGQVGAETPSSAAQPPAAEPPASVVPQPGQGAAPVSTSPPASLPPAGASVPGKGKAKGHEKSHGPPAPPAPVVPTAPDTSPAPEAPPQEADQDPAGEGPGNGHGHAYGHSK